jgi:hypothetical protein
VVPKLGGRQLQCLAFCEQGGKGHTRLEAREWRTGAIVDGQPTMSGTASWGSGVCWTSIRTRVPMLDDRPKPVERLTRWASPARHVLVNS